MERNRSLGMRRQRPTRKRRDLGSSRAGQPRLMGLLGLPVAVHDPVTIITAAQIRLRRWRRLLNDGPVGKAPDRTAAANDRIRRITQARDALLRRAVVPEDNGVWN